MGTTLHRYPTGHEAMSIGLRVKLKCHKQAKMSRFYQRTLRCVG